MEKVLFMVPHEDDELVIGGALLINLARDGKYELFVFIATNGDYYPKEHALRINESIAALEKMGVKSENIIFGGYGDGWVGTHIYNSNPDRIKRSKAGHEATYLDGTISEWHYLQHKVHQKYTRKGYFLDIKNLITYISPDVIVCVDMDEHSDHRCLSLLTDEALGEILKERREYHPVLLKKFAYENELLGECDFFVYPHRRTVSESDATQNPYFKWNDRISYKSPDDCRTIFLNNNFLYKISKIYKTQGIWINTPSFVNEDTVYWKRNTKNALLNAKISVSSGEKKYINDFKLIDSSDIDELICDYSNMCWRPDETDTEKEISADFDKTVNIDYISLYFNSPGGLIGKYNCKLTDVSGKVQTVQRIIDNTEDFFVDKLTISSTNICRIVFDFSELKGNVGLGEIEILTGTVDVPFKEYLYNKFLDNEYPNDKEKEINRSFLFLNCMLSIENFAFSLRQQIYYKTDKYFRFKQ